MMINVGQGLLNALLYMGPLAVIGGLVCMYFWERTCRLKLKVVLVKQAGGSVPYYVLKEGNEVNLANLSTEWSGTWPISDLATIPQPYPDLAGLLPRFLQREIQMAIFLEGDIEPLLNRSPHRMKVMSPDVYNSLLDLKEDYSPDSENSNAELVTKIEELLEGVSTGLSRELIAAPDWVSSLRKSTALKALASVSDDLMEALKQIRNQLSRFSGLNSTYVYIGLGFIIALLGFNLYYTMQVSVDVTSTIPPDVLQKIDAIYYNVMEAK